MLPATFDNPAKDSNVDFDKTLSEEEEEEEEEEESTYLGGPS